MEELIIRERKFREEIAELINNSEIPAIMIKPILKELCEQASILEIQQYNKAIEKQNNTKEENKTEK